MSEAIAWLEEAKTELERWDYEGRLPEPQPQYDALELRQIIVDFWSEKKTIGETYAFLIAIEQNINPFEIKKVFDQMNRDLEDFKARVGIE